MILIDIFSLQRSSVCRIFYPEPTTFSFPSGHALNAVLLFYFFPHLCEACGWLAKGLRNVLLSPLVCAVGIFLISMSRVFLGVHWFSDIVAGVIYGFLISEIGMKIFQKMESTQSEI